MPDKGEHRQSMELRACRVQSRSPGNPRPRHCDEGLGIESVDHDRDVETSGTSLAAVTMELRAAGLWTPPQDQDMRAQRMTDAPIRRDGGAISEDREEAAERRLDQHKASGPSARQSSRIQ